MGKEMKTEEILNLDCTEKNVRELISKFINKVDYAPEGHTGIYTVHELEKILHKMCKEEKYRLQYINITYEVDKYECWYSSGVLILENREWIGNVYGASIWELYAKAVILIYADRRHRRNEKNNV